MAAAVIAALSAPSASAQSLPDYKKLIAKVRKQSVAATLGYRCVPIATPPYSECPETQPTYPLKTSGKLTVKRGDRITLLFAAPVGDVSWWTARVNGLGKETATATGTAKLVTRTKKRWRITLPKNLRRSSTILGVYAQSPNAQASFELGLKVR